MCFCFDIIRELLSPYDYWQYWRNCSDKDAFRYKLTIILYNCNRFLKYFTDIDVDDIEYLERKICGGSKDDVINTITDKYLSISNINDVKVLLADSVTGILHGSDCLLGIHQTAQQLFASEIGTNLLNLSGIPRFQLAHLLNEIGDDRNVDRMPFIADVLVKTGLLASKTAAKKALISNSIRINQEKITGKYLESSVLELKYFKDGQVLLSYGKTNHIVIEGGEFTKH